MEEAVSEDRRIPKDVLAEFDGTCEELRGALGSGNEQAAFGLFFRLEGIRDALVLMGKDAYWLDKSFRKRVGNKHPELMRSWESPHLYSEDDVGYDEHLGEDYERQP